MKLIFAASILSTLSLCFASAQNGKATPAPPSVKPANDPDMAKLAFLVGRYVTQTEVYPTPMMPKGGHGTGTSVITWTLDNKFLKIEDGGLNSMFGEYKGMGMLGFDAHTHEYVLAMFNNFGERPTYRGILSNDTLVLKTTVPMPGKSFDQKLLWYKDGGKVVLRVLNDQGEGYHTVVEQTAMPESQK